MNRIAVTWTCCDPRTRTPHEFACCAPRRRAGTEECLERMKRYLKIAVLVLLKYSGVLALARWLTRRQLRILCYHGISVGDQHEYEPLLFMRAATFDRRMQSLIRQGWKVVGLAEAVDALRTGALPDRTAVITIDDGWASTWAEAVPILKKHALPATLYVTTYYAERGHDVFNVALHYMTWKSPLDVVNLCTGLPGLDGEYRIRPGGMPVVAEWIHKTRGLTAEERQAMLPSIAASLGLDAAEVFSESRFKLVSPAQVRELSDDGVDIQLHTHRHHLPEDSYESLVRELSDNRERLEAWTGKACDHFCYPSGVYTLQQSEWLQNAGIRSSTTCDVGHNPVGMHPQRLRRILDRESWADVEFEAALSGLNDLFKLRSRRAVPAE